MCCGSAMLNRLSVAYITHSATLPLSHASGSSSSENMQLPLDPQKALYYFFYICCNTPQDLYTQFNVYNW